MITRSLAVVATCSLTVLTPVLAQAEPILSPVAATASSEFDATYDIGNTIDRSGLSSAFVSGVTDFDAYIATNPTHTLIAANNEWFTPQGVTSATVTYDLGAVYSISRWALWNEESSGMGSVNVFASLDNVTFTPVLMGFSPIDRPLGADYPAQVVNLGIAAARFVRLDISACPQATSGFDGCAMGESAFAVSPAQAPEPATLVLLGFGVAAAARRRFGRRN